MTSVSMSVSGRGAATLVSETKLFMCGSRPERPHVGETSSDGGGRRHGRAHQMRPAALSLPALEIAVRRGGATLAGAEPVVVHGDTHRAAGIPPFEAGGLKDAIEAFGLRLHAH